LQIQSFEEQLRQFPADLDAQAATLAGELEAAKRRLAQSRENSQLIRGRIEQLAATAPYQSLAEAEEEGEEIQQELAALSLAADAALLLRNTVAECRAALLDDVAGTVARDAGAILNEIAGAPLGELHLSTKLTPDALVPASWNEAVDLTQLSGGENEQVHVATRLALADRLSAQEPQLVVFDDVLMATDPERLARILALLEERRGRLQVLILTCHPERFEGLSEVHRAPLTRASL
jgi:ABC-type glutathione transport system ATPase component